MKPKFTFILMALVLFIINSFAANENLFKTTHRKISNFTGNNTYQYSKILLRTVRCPDSTIISLSFPKEFCLDEDARPLSASVNLSGNDGDPVLSYQWYYNTSNTNDILTAEIIDGAIDETYIPLTDELGTKYYFCVGYSNECSQDSATQDLASDPVEITVTNANITPTFIQLGPLCQNSTPTTLPFISEEDITGTWDPSEINTSIVGETTYTFTPDAGQCAIQTEMVVEITDQVTPTFTQLGPLCQNSTPPSLPSISEEDITGTWDPSEINTSTVGETTYTFTPDKDQCADIATMDIEVAPAMEVKQIDGKPHDNPVVLIYPKENLEYKWFRDGLELLGTGQYYIIDAPGSYYVKVRNLDGDCWATSASVVAKSAMGKIFHSINSTFLMYPNPTRDNLTVLFNTDLKFSLNEVKINIINIQGKTVIVHNVENILEPINIRSLNPGIYILSAYNKNECIDRKKLVITK